MVLLSLVPMQKKKIDTGRMKIIFFNLILTLFCISSACAYQENAHVEWLARTNDASLEPVLPNLQQAHLFLQTPNPVVLGTEESNINVYELIRGEWLKIKSQNIKVKSKQFSKLVFNFDPNPTYSWAIEDEEFVVRKINNKPSAQKLFSISAGRLSTLLFKDTTLVFGDEKSGFWITNSSGNLVYFIEPTSWSLLEVPWLSDIEKNDSDHRFYSVAYGENGTLWTLENKGQKIVRRDRMGRILATVNSPFKVEKSSSGLPTYGEGVLSSSSGGVLVTSPTRLELAFLNNQGQLQRHISICPGEATEICVRQALKRGQLSKFLDVTADQRGNILASDGLRLFLFSASGDIKMLRGEVPPCMQPHDPAHPLGMPYAPCVSANYRAVPLETGRLLLLPDDLFDGSPIELRISQDKKGLVELRPFLDKLMDLPFETKKAIFNIFSDIGFWRINSNEINRSSVDYIRGIPTVHGLVTPQSILSQYLSPPADAIRTQEDRKISGLFGQTAGTFSYEFMAARLDKDKVLIRDRNYLAPRFAVYDAKNKTLRHNVRLPQLKDPSVLNQDGIANDHLFNDDRGNVYFFDGDSGNLYSISTRLSISLLARLNPILNANHQCRCCVNLVSSAVLSAPNQLMIATNCGIFLQNAESLVRISTLEQVSQLIPIEIGFVLAISSGGLARIQLPKKEK